MMTKTVSSDRESRLSTHGVMEFQKARRVRVTVDLYRCREQLLYS